MKTNSKLSVGLGEKSNFQGKGERDAPSFTGKIRETNCIFTKSLKGRQVKSLDRRDEKKPHGNRMSEGEVKSHKGGGALDSARLY